MREIKEVEGMKLLIHTDDTGECCVGGKYIYIYIIQITWIIYIVLVYRICSNSNIYVVI